MILHDDDALINSLNQRIILFVPISNTTDSTLCYYNSVAQINQECSANQECQERLKPRRDGFRKEET